MDMTRVLAVVEVAAAITEGPWGRVVFVCARNAKRKSLTSGALNVPL
jgi:hypothetical protein